MVIVKVSPQKNSAQWLYIDCTKIIGQYNIRAIVLLLSVLVSGVADARIQARDVWHFIPQMNPVVKKLTVDDVNRAPLAFKLINQNEYINFYQVREKVKLEDASTITDIELRLSKSSGGMAPFLRFSLNGRCFTLSDVKKHYHDAKLSNYPRGDSENETTSYTSFSDMDKNEITFSFNQKKPICLTNVTITTIQ
ncbi:MULTISPECIES: hypothetical protein [Pantoea]|nr:MULTISPECIES: hypothetical protein [Pantoea]MCW0316005.1 hypothetical protein [Pantoea ananatis]MCW0334146.1 hypothetical protein [Pantoea ananatis]MCW0382324.1 hypothetical protein [Pantoea ananatis]MCW0406988.1 hypothetical protein [Pantoea ananatis]MCW0427162.1 hypothetical protein [Pantoea ananatis]